uniref:Peptidase C19 ubiquitin carboxyl-terminal hydrolase domain-containing protein n=1 Tax=Chromera velia CCMP2878 TaxID=1169474 RepID=A0A0G4IDK3_9ALVE|eukprot:Cvel_13321.t1-p1 / transcript=Cvel_13321.t1 / gene=Cvel_13321 / organism=Chromera_velia_CCMP2878 / gene_product=hypothetical protein / transcript_product=hypothetical protein / location=Cvel_scaffold904:29346-30016(+) / protein_length=183 / sequence_SO=supercontig / SO=protein_coding / is_pseudo=false
MTRPALKTPASGEGDVVSVSDSDDEVQILFVPTGEVWGGLNIPAGIVNRNNQCFLISVIAVSRPVLAEILQKFSNIDLNGLLNRLSPVFEKLQRDIEQKRGQQCATDAFARLMDALSVDAMQSGREYKEFVESLCGGRLRSTVFCKDPKGETVQQAGPLEDFDVLAVDIYFKKTGALTLEQCL